MTKLKRMDLLLPLLMVVVLLTGLTALDAFAAIFLLYLWKKGSEKMAADYLQKDFSFLVWLLPILLYIAHVFKHWSLNTHAWDMSFTHQALYYPFSPHLLHNDLSINNTFLGEHLSFTFFPLGFFFQYIKNDYALFWFHTLVLAGGVWALVRFGPTKKSTFALWVFWLFLFASKSLRGAFLFDFREDTLAFAGLCLSFIFLQKGSWKGYTFSLLGVLLSKENYGLITIFMVIPIWLDPEIDGRKKKLLALTTIILSLGWTAISFKFLIPHFTMGVDKAHPIILRFGEFGSTPKEILLNILTEPKHWWTLITRYLLTWGRLKYMIYLLVPYLYFCRRYWYWLIPTLPGLAMNLFSASPNQIMMIFHYDLMILPFIFWAFLKGISVEKSAKVVLTGLLLALCFSGKWPTYNVFKFRPSLNDIKNSMYLENLPQKHVTAANLTVLAHLNHLPHFRILNPHAADFESFAALNQRPDPRSKLKAWDATHFVLDLSRPEEKNSASLLTGAGWVPESLSPDGRFVYLRKL